MYYLIDFCCICFYNKKNLQPLSDFDSDNITYFIKLTFSVPEMCFNEMNDQWLVCNECCETMDAAYKFRQSCLRSKSTLTDYISQLRQVSNISDVANVYLNDINKFCDIKKIYDKENDIEKTEISNVNEEKNLKINHITDIKRENNSCSSKLIDTEHIQFENVVIETEQDNPFFDENVNENFVNTLVNQDDIKIGVCENNILLASAIKKENETQDFDEHLHRFDNILKTCHSENDGMEITVKENYDHSLYSEKYSDDPLANLNEIKIDIETINGETNIQYKTESIEEFTTADNVKFLKDQDEDKTDKESTCFHTTLEEKQKTSLSANTKKPIQKKTCGIVNQKEKIIEKYECHICKKNFVQFNSLVVHIRIHTGEKPHECSVCQKKFIQSSNLKKHMRIHTGEKPYECDVCQKKFTQLATLMCHKRIHTGEKPHECDVCQKKFNQPSHLREHMKVHTGEKLHECEVCQKKFNHASNLRKHMKIHTGEKHKCGVCQKKFTQLATLMRHKKIHTEEKLHECEVCQKKFNQSSYLRKHMRIHTEEETV